MNHILDIHVYDRPFSTEYIHIVDKSVYLNRVKPTNEVLKIKIPGIPNPVYPRFQISQDNSYTSLSLKLFKTSNKIEDLPDGVYEITYSVCPNELVFKTVFHFRTAIIESKLYNKAIDSLEVCKNDEDEDNNRLEIFKNCSLLIELCKKSASVQNFIKAEYFYKKVLNILENV